MTMTNILLGMAIGLGIIIIIGLGVVIALLRHG